MLNLLIAYQIIKNPILDQPKPKVETVQVAPKPVTEADNPQHCNLDTQWTASESPFYCINKPTEDQTPATAPQNSSYNGYQPGQCVWGVKEWRPDIPGNWGSAYQWLYNARADGWATGYTPKVNAVGVEGNHVVLVTAVSGSTITIREMNYDYVPFHQRYREAPASEFTFIY